MDQLWCRVSALVAAKTGLRLAPSGSPDLERALTTAAQEYGSADPVAYATELLSQASPAQLQMLVRHVTVGETYFWRDGSMFDALSQLVLPNLLRARAGDRELKVWSAACCTGEEAYSLAVLIEQCVPDLQRWRIEIHGTDINDAFLQRAAAGVYGEWSFRGVPEHFKERYFERTASGRYAIHPRIRNKVRFATHNLIEDPCAVLAGGTMDLILCRNVLMYLTLEQARRVIGNLRCALSADGWLIVGASECSTALLQGFSAQVRNGVTLYRKQPSKTQSDSTESAPEHTTREMAPCHLVHSAPAIEPGSAAATDCSSPCASAALHYERQRYAEVVEILSRVPHAEAAASRQTCALLARSLANIGRLDDALQWSRWWLAIERLDAEAHYVQAMIMQELGRIENARQVLRHAIYIDPQMTLAHLALGNLARAAGRGVQAAKHFSNALESLRDAAPESLLAQGDGLTVRQLQGMLRSLLARTAAS